MFNMYVHNKQIFMECFWKYEGIMESLKFDK